MLALVTCAEARTVDDDLPLLASVLPEAEIVEWHDPGVDWSGYERVIIRSAWDYHRRRDAFLAWAASVEAVSELWNPLELLRWNTDKRYLEGLRAGGVPIVPSTFLLDRDAVEAHAAAAGFEGALVVKPTVGASASGVLATHGDADLGVEHARTLVDAGLVAMVQPYLVEVEGRGETGLVYLGGEFSHAFRRRVVLRPAAELDGDVLGQEESGPRIATEDERAVGDRVMRLLPRTAYARIDLLPTDTGPVVLEVEVTEPSLFLGLADGAPERAAAAFRSL